MRYRIQVSIGMSLVIMEVFEWLNGRVLAFQVEGPGFNSREHPLDSAENEYWLRPG